MSGKEARQQTTDARHGRWGVHTAMTLSLNLSLSLFLTLSLSVCVQPILLLIHLTSFFHPPSFPPPFFLFCLLRSFSPLISDSLWLSCASTYCLQMVCMSAPQLAWMYGRSRVRVHLQPLPTTDFSAET